MVRNADTAKRISVRLFLRGISDLGTPYAWLSYGTKSEGLIDASHDELYGQKSVKAAAIPCPCCLFRLWLPLSYALVPYFYAPQNFKTVALCNDAS
jgi:hypothetical protein